MSATQVKNTSFFKPSDIAGCAMWLDGKDPAGTGTAPANGSTVSTWTDKSSNGFNATAVNNPTYSSSASGINFTYSSSQYYTLPNGTLPYGDTSYSYFIICNWTGNSGPYGIIGAGVLATDQLWVIRNTTGANTVANYWYSDDITTTTTMTPGQTTCIGAFYISGKGLRSVWINFSSGVSGNPANNRNQPTTNCTIGAAVVSQSEYMSGTISEVIVYNTSLSQTQRQQVEGYLAWKWGLNGSLPPTHPYYTVQSYATALYYPKSITKITSTNITHPLAIAGLSLWLDGQDIRGTGAAYPTGSTVTTWTDKSGNQRNATASSGGVSYTMTFGIYPGLVFTNSQYLLGNISITGNTLSIFSMFSLANQGTGGAGRLIGLAATGQNDYNSGSYMGLLRQGGTSFGPYRNGTFTGNTVSYDTPTIMEAWYDGTNQFSIINGGLTPLSNAFSGNFSISSYAVANNTNLGDIPNGPLYGSIGEVIVYNISPTQSQRQLIEGYLAWKWGRQASLAAGHPYQTVVPMYPPYANPVVRSIVNRPLV